MGKHRAVSSDPAENGDQIRRPRAFFFSVSPAPKLYTYGASVDMAQLFPYHRELLSWGRSRLAVPITQSMLVGAVCAIVVFKCRLNSPETENPSLQEHLGSSLRRLASFLFIFIFS